MKKHFHLALAAALFATSGLAFAADMSASTTRDERMDSALQDYRNKHANDQPGPAARAEESMKRGLHKTGDAIEHGASATGHAVKKGVHKTGEAIHHVGEKIENSKAAN